MSCPGEKTYSPLLVLPTSPACTFHHSHSLDVRYQSRTSTVLQAGIEPGNQWERWERVNERGRVSYDEMRFCGREKEGRCKQWIGSTNWNEDPFRILMKGNHQNEVLHLLPSSPVCLPQLACFWRNSSSPWPIIMELMSGLWLYRGWHLL